MLWSLLSCYVFLLLFCRYFDNHWCCMDRMTAHQIHISSSSDKLNELINTRRSNENLVKLAASASSGEYDDETAVEDRPAYDIDVSELEEQLAAASLIQMNTIAISPILYETDVFNGSDIGTLLFLFDSCLIFVVIVSCTIPRNLRWVFKPVSYISVGFKCEKASVCDWVFRYAEAY